MPPSAVPVGQPISQNQHAQEPGPGRVATPDSVAVATPAGPRVTVPLIRCCLASTVVALSQADEQAVTEVVPGQLKPAQRREDPLVEERGRAAVCDGVRL